LNIISFQVHSSFTFRWVKPATRHYTGLSFLNLLLHGDSHLDPLLGNFKGFFKEFLILLFFLSFFEDTWITGNNSVLDGSQRLGPLIFWARGLIPNFGVYLGLVWGQIYPGSPFISGG